MNVKERLQELRFGVHQEENKERKEEENPQKQRHDGFEPFVNDDKNGEGDLFINLYGGNFSKKMELNRDGVERILKIAHLDGKVFLSSLSPNRQRPIGVESQSNELAAKRFLFFGEKRKKEEEENPLIRVESVPQGWRIEINDRKLTEELTEKEKLTSEELQRVFVRRFNGVLKEGLLECIWREKCSSVKDKYYKIKLFSSIANGIIPFLILINSYGSFDFVYTMGVIAISYAINNTLNSVLSRLGCNNIITRNIDHPLEFFMPFVEVDKVERALAYLQGKGRTLAREL